MNELGEIVKVRRELLGLTQRALAQELGIQPSYVSFLERGLRKPSVGVIQRLAKALIVDCQDLLAVAHPAISLRDDFKSAKANSASSKRLGSEHVLLRRYHLTKDELKVIEGLSLFGRLSLKEFIGILTLVWNIQSSPKGTSRPSRNLKS
jgi:transcriptional regulator with XRE-family HTH domain